MDANKKEALNKHVNSYFSAEQVFVIEALINDVLTCKEKIKELVDRVNEQANTINALIGDNEKIVDYIINREKEKGVNL
ncbi:MAG: hypothetical protein ACRCZL_00440 [Cetobacterium sp.]